MCGGLLFGVQQGRGQQKLHDANARIQKMNARHVLRKEAPEQIKKIRIQGKQIIGKQRTAYGAQGVALDTGTALAVQEDTARMVELDSVMAMNNAYRKAWGYQQAGRFQKYYGNVAQREGVQRAVSGGGEAVAKYYTAGQA